MITSKLDFVNKPPPAVMHCLKALQACLVKAMGKGEFTRGASSELRLQGTFTRTVFYQGR